MTSFSSIASKFNSGPEFPESPKPGEMFRLSGGTVVYRFDGRKWTGVGTTTSFTTTSTSTSTTTTTSTSTSSTTTSTSTSMTTTTSTSTTTTI